MSIPSQAAIHCNVAPTVAVDVVRGRSIAGTLFDALVTEPTELTRPIHGSMPATLDRCEIDVWLCGSTGYRLPQPVSNDLLRMWPVSKRVNKTGSGADDPTVVERIVAYLGN